jgi:hypothetical protein
MEFHVLQAKTAHSEKPVQRPYLINNIVNKVFFGYVHEASTKTEKVRITGMSPCHYAVPFTQFYCAIHYSRVRGMEPARYAGRGDIRRYFFITPYSIDTEGFTHVTIDVYF